MSFAILNEDSDSGYFYSASSSPSLLRGAPNYSIDTVSGLTHAKALQAPVSEGLAQGLYMTARVGFDPPTLRMQGTKLTTEPPCSVVSVHIVEAESCQ